MGKDPAVVLKSRTINNSAIVHVYKIEKQKFGDWEDTRELSVKYTFINFQTTMPYKHALALIRRYPMEFYMDEKPEIMTKKQKQMVNYSEEMASGFICEKCGKEAKSKMGLISHMRKHKYE